MPTTYNAIADSDVDSESPGTENLFKYLRDNPIAITEGAAGAPTLQTAGIADGAITAIKIGTAAVTNTKLGSGSVTEAKLGAAAVSRSILNTATREENTGSIGAGTSAPMFFTAYTDGYGFYPQLRSGSGKQFTAYLGYDVSQSSSAVVVSVVNTDVSAHTIYCEFRYVTASPPYDLGDGDVAMFAFVGLRGGKIGPASLGDDPPWMGPHLVPDFRRDGKAFKRERVLPFSLTEAKGDPAKLQAYLDALRNGPVREIEITKEYKNRDMHVRPHPQFHNVDRVLMLDPMSPVLFELQQLRAQGESVLQLLEDGYIELGDPVLRKGPPGVEIVGLRWKGSL